MARRVDQTVCAIAIFDLSDLEPYISPMTNYWVITDDGQRYGPADLEPDDLRRHCDKLHLLCSTPDGGE